jgi:2-polyprenyl-3-methyl-5-hydroxy-6-metoxy-1,4-benzoquinol methylase
MESQTASENLSDWPAEDLEAVPRCPVCGSERRNILYRGLTDRVFFCAPGAWDLFRCMDCTSAYLDPRPTPASISRAYSRYFTHGGEWREAPEQLSPLRRVLRALSNGYFNHRFGTDFKPANPLGVLLAWLTPWKRGDLESVGRHLPKAKPGQSLLDVGCGNGIFLDFARHAGWQAQGVDFDAEAVACCVRKGLAVQLGGIEVLADQTERFDWITLSHVIEHVYDPVGLLRACHRLLKPGGGLWISTPNLDAQGHHDFGAAWRGLEPPRHLVLFSRSSLFRALRDADFQDVTDAPFCPLYRDLAHKSQAIADGRDPYQTPTPRKPSLRSLIADWRAWRDPNRREFITLVARKGP